MLVTGISDHISFFQIWTDCNNQMWLKVKGRNFSSFSVSIQQVGLFSPQMRRIFSLLHGLTHKYIYGLWYQCVNFPGKYGSSNHRIPTLFNVIPPLRGIGCIFAEVANKLIINPPNETPPHSSSSSPWLSVAKLPRATQPHQEVVSS